MTEPSLIVLDLHSPLIYAETQALPPDNPEKYSGQEELLFCFELDPAQSRAFEPEQGRLLGPLVFAGSTENGGTEKTVLLPAGTYLFVQRRRALNKDEWLGMAVEQQKDGLWERHKPQPRLYLRYLFEDGSPVTQLFRPVKNVVHRLPDASKGEK